MEKLDLWCKLVSAFSIISTLFMLIVPEGSLKKAFNTLITVILVFVMIYPLKGREDEMFSFAEKYEAANTDFSIDVGSYEDAALILAVQGETEDYLNEAMKSAGIECMCNVICDYKDAEIIITKVTVEGNINFDEKAYITQKVKEVSKDETEVTFKGELYE